MRIAASVKLPKNLFNKDSNISAMADAFLDKEADKLRQKFEELTSSWKTDVKFHIVKGLYSRRVTTSNKIYKYVSLGTKPHIIKPKRVKKLKFEVNGETVFAREVHHPGIKAKNYGSQVTEAFNVEFQVDAAQFAKSVIKG